MITLGKTSGASDAPAAQADQFDRGVSLGEAAPPSPPRATAFDVTEAYDHHGGQLFGFALNALRDRGAAEDCVQETFVRAWRFRHRYDANRASTRTWLFSIARNVIADAQRVRRRWPQVAETEDVTDRAVRDPDPADRLGLMEALATLSREQRQVVVAIHLIGMTYAELSATVGVPVPTLRTRAFYGLRALRSYLDGRID
ncbi:sigma-70 family RNA polymerase sigma factor [Citricoccus sp.]|uniref:RNA polymerase sigma factor n=1 Tax=Citricoccus sp. TaxID=1978372 RepID=UPI0028BD5A02|nr:sigma-70 family RNA polymerase sigma factor [Citricoccus sp.]